MFPRTLQQQARFRGNAVAALAVLVAGVLMLTWAARSEAGPFAPPLAVTVVSKTVVVPPGDDTVRSVARCPPGSVVTGGGVRVGIDSPILVEFDAPAPDGESWQARMASVDDEDASPYRARIVAVCAPGSAASVIARAR